MVPSVANPIDYLVELADLRITPPKNLDIATVQDEILANSFRFHIRQYLSRRAEDWKVKGFIERLVDWPSLNARSKYWGDDQRSAFKNWEEITDPRNPLGGRQGVDERIMLRELLRRVDMMVILENKLDVNGSNDSLLPKICAVDAVGIGATNNEFLTPYVTTSFLNFFQSQRPDNSSSFIPHKLCWNSP